MFVIKASTPEAMRNEIVKWLNKQASNQRVAAGLAKRKNVALRNHVAAQTYGDAATFLEGCKVEVPAIYHEPNCKCDNCTFPY